jgi:hypothetical protein
MAVVDEMVGNWSFWSQHIPQIIGTSESAAAAYLGKYLHRAASDKLGRYRIMGEWVWRNREALGLPAA